MAATNTKRDWNRLTEEEDLLERKPKARTEISTYVREKEGTRAGQKVRETVKVEKRIFPVNKQVLARKEMKKFGDVAGVPQGQHLKGDFVVSAEVNIETMLCADKGEIDIVNKLSKINTESIKIKKDKEKMELLAQANKEGRAVQQQTAPQNDFIEVGDKSKKQQPKTLDSLNFGNENDEYTVEISNILSFYNAKTEEAMQEEERKFKLFLEEFVGKSSHINRYQARFPKNKKTRELMGKTFITFYDKTIAENLIEDIEGEEYGNSILSADWAKARVVGRR